MIYMMQKTAFKNIEKPALKTRNALVRYRKIEFRDMSDLSRFLRFFEPKIVILSPITLKLGNNIYFMPTNHIKKTPSKNIEIYLFYVQKTVKIARRDTSRATLKRP